MKKTLTYRGANKSLYTSFTVVLFIFLLSFFPFLLSACGGKAPENDPYFKGAARDSLTSGNEWYKRGCYKEALTYFEESLSAARLSDNIPMIITSLNAQSATLMALKDYNKAANVLSFAFNLSLNESNHPSLPAILGNLGTIAYKTNRFDDAISFWERAANEAELVGESPSVFLANIARDDYNRGKDNSFAQSLNKAMESLSHPGTDSLTKADIYNLAGIAALKNGNILVAQEYIFQALDLDRQEENQEGMAEDLEAIALIYKEQKDYDKTTLYLDRAFFLQTALKNKEAANRILGLLEETSKVYDKVNLEEYRKISHNPSLFDPLKTMCPH